MGTFKLTPLRHGRSGWQEATLGSTLDIIRLHPQRPGRLFKAVPALGFHKRPFRR